MLPDFLYLKEIYEAVNQKREDALGHSLTDGLTQYIREAELLPGTWGGFDPAQVKDRSAFVMLAKDIPTLETPETRLRIRMMQDLSLDKDGKKGASYMSQVARIIQIDKRHRMVKLAVDITKDTTCYELLQTYFKDRVIGVKFNVNNKYQMLQSLRILMQEKMIEFSPTHMLYSLIRSELYHLDTRTLRHPDTVDGSDDFVWATALAVQATNVASNHSSFESGFVGEERLV